MRTSPSSSTIQLPVYLCPAKNTSTSSLSQRTTARLMPDGSITSKTRSPLSLTRWDTLQRFPISLPPLCIWNQQVCPLFAALALSGFAKGFELSACSGGASSGAGCGSGALAIGVSTGGAGTWAVEKNSDRIARMMTTPKPIMLIGTTISKASKACWLENPAVELLLRRFIWNNLMASVCGVGLRSEPGCGE